MNAHLFFSLSFFRFALCINRCFFENYFVLSFFLIEWMGKELDAMTTKDKVLQLLKRHQIFFPEKSWHSNWKFPGQVFGKPSKNWKGRLSFEHGPTGYRYLPSDVLDAKKSSKSYGRLFLI